MPYDKRRYPADWPEIARRVKEAAGWRCQACGMQCRRPGEPFDTHKRTLTVHHINHEPMDLRPENLIALCSGCHLRADARHHAATRKKRAQARVLPFEYVQRTHGSGWMEEVTPPIDDETQPPTTLRECVWLNGWMLVWECGYEYCDIYTSEDAQAHYNRADCGMRIWSDRPGPKLMAATPWG